MVNSLDLVKLATLHVGVKTIWTTGLKHKSKPSENKRGYEYGYKSI